MSTSKYRVESCCATLPVERALHRFNGFARQFCAAGPIHMLLHEDEVSGFILYIFDNEPSVGSELQRPACNVRSRVANVLLIILMC
jgi:hypothetical protein